MKKALYTSTALAAAGLLSLASTGAFAQSAAPAPAQKLQVSVGGFMLQTVGYAHQKMDASGGQSYKHFDQKSDSELYFKGSINLDNGLTVGLNVELETDVDQTTNVDASYLTVGNADLGTLYLGNGDAAVFYLTVQAPSAGIGLYDGTQNTWLVAPAASVSTGTSTGISGTDYNRIEYLSPSILGFRAGAGYTPSQTASQTQPLATETDGADAGLQWAGDFGGIKPRLSALWFRTNAATTSTIDNYQIGGDITFADITIGSGYGTIRHRGDGASTIGTALNSTTSRPDSHTWNVGVKYNPGPFAVALTYGQAWAEDTIATSADDKSKYLTLGGEYILGPGVTWMGNIFGRKWDDELSTATHASENSGWAVVTGIKLDF